jgi:hypothetical protein
MPLSLQDHRTPHSHANSKAVQAWFHVPLSVINRAQAQRLYKPRYSLALEVLLAAFPRGTHFFGGDFAVFIGVNHIEAF